MNNLKTKFPETIFVFGSNDAGRHSKGAALFAKQNFGAIMGQSEGLMDRSYAIPTRHYIDSKNLTNLSLNEIENNVKTFLEFAKNNPQLYFQVTEIGTGLAGYEQKDILPFFKERTENVFLSYRWEKELNPNLKKHLIVAGGREFDDYELLKTKLDFYLKDKKEEFVIISGGAKGADNLGEKYAIENNIPYYVMEAEWNYFKKQGFVFKAGNIRNEKMAWYASHLVCFWDGESKGTKNMIEIGKKYELFSRVVNYQKKDNLKLNFKN